MQGNFTYYNPTKLYFGDQSLAYLKDELANFGERARTSLSRRPASILSSVAGANSAASTKPPMPIGGA